MRNFQIIFPLIITETVSSQILFYSLTERVKGFFLSQIKLNHYHDTKSQIVTKRVNGFFLSQIKLNHYHDTKSQIVTERVNGFFLSQIKLNRYHDTKSQIVCVCVLAYYYVRYHKALYSYSLEARHMYCGQLEKLKENLNRNKNELKRFISPSKIKW